MTPSKLVLAVVDGAKPSQVDRAIERGDAPVLQAIVERGTFVRDSCAAFPSVTPVCATSIATGELQDRHLIAAMNWFHRDERRYVEYGSSFRAASRFGIHKQLADTVYRMNAEHLSDEVQTVFESLDDAGVRTAGTTFLIYRGRHRHTVSRDTALTRLAGQLFRKPVLGPRELFYADIYASRDTGCRGQLGLPGVRDKHSGCVAAWLAQRDLFDFLLLSLPDNDTHSHKNGPHAQADSIASADKQLQRLADATGGLDAFLDTHAVIVAADHSHAPVERAIAFLDGFDGFEVAGPGRAKVADAELALCPSQRSAMVYALLPEGRDALVPRIVETAGAIDGVDLLAWRDGADGVIRAPARGELRFRPGGDVGDRRGGRWTVEGDLSTLEATIADGVLESPAYPDALRRVHAALTCPTSGDVLLSAAPGWEFPDWGGVTHVGGGSHGSLHSSDSLGSLLFCGVDADTDRPAGWQWSITDVAGLVREHFGVPSGA
jgi:hypothetical protein